MQLSKVESLKLMQLWNDYGQYLDEILSRQIKEYELSLYSSDDQWCNTKQLVEYLAKKQTLIDFKKLCSSRYE